MGCSQVETLIEDIWRTSPGRMAEFLTEGRFKRFAHIQFLDRKIAHCLARRSARLVISMPPRHGKSWLTSFYTPAWFLSLWPDRNVILTSYEASFAASWGKQVRNFMQEHRATLEMKLANDSLASDRWNTIEGGGMITAGIGGPITGRGGHLLIIDDPVKNWEEASSETYRQKTIDWFNSTLYTRAEPGASIVILMTRWHEMDLAGYLLSEHQDPWEHVRLPALAEAADPLHRNVDTALCPERYDETKLKAIKLAVGSRMWNALYQQRPSPEEGNIISRGWLKFYKNLPSDLNLWIITADLSFKDSSTCDYTVFQVWASCGSNCYLIDQIRDRMNFPTVIRQFKSFSIKYPEVLIKIVEEGGNGAALIQTLQNETMGIIAIKPKESKSARLSNVSALIEAGNVFFPDPAIAPWIGDNIEELCNFPNAAHDDTVDATVYALSRFKEDQISLESLIALTKW
jgi:predicted phage terminase large subunit-like protein